MLRAARNIAVEEAGETAERFCSKIAFRVKLYGHFGVDDLPDVGIVLIKIKSVDEFWRGEDGERCG